MRQRAATLLYLFAGAGLGIGAGVVLLCGWIAVGLLAVTPLLVPMLIAFRAAVGGLAWLEARLANALLGTDVAPPLLARPVRGYWSRGAAVAGDGAFWRQQAFLLQGLILRGGIAIAELTILAAGLGGIAEPITYRWSSTEFGSWHVDTLGRAFLFVVPGLVALAIGIGLLGPFGRLFARLARTLLAGRAEPLRREQVRALHRQGLRLHGLAVVALGLLTTVIWAATTRTYFWPEWVVVPLALPLGLHAVALAAFEHDESIRRRRLTPASAIAAGTAVLLELFFVAIWTLTTRAYFWPAWVALPLALVAGGWLAVARWHGGTQRIAQLEATRAGAVDVQGAELRRIERDLHDGAQARLVALGMSIGMAEQKLASDPGAAQALLAEARRGAHEALEELRDLARGIHPPVLADRGLEAAVSALAGRSPLAVELSAHLPGRPAAPVETAAYFVVSESLANAGKHAGASRVEIELRASGDALVVSVTDDGMGGADAGGAGLRGLRQRVEALDGSLAVASPPGGGTRIEAVMPCAW
jgi:signal transduction histidine kinase